MQSSFNFPQPIQSILLSNSNSKTLSNFLSPQGKPNYASQRMNEIFNYEYYSDWTPQEISLKRNYDIKNLMKQTKIFPKKSLDKQALLALRDKQKMDNIQNNKVKNKQHLMHRPNSQGSIITVATNPAQTQQLNQNYQYNQITSQSPLMTLQMSQPQLMIQPQIQNLKSFGLSSSTLTFNDPQQPLVQIKQNLPQSLRMVSRLSKSRAELYQHLRKGYALSQKAPRTQITKNSVFKKPRQSIYETNTSNNTNNYDNFQHYQDLDRMAPVIQSPDSPSMASTHRGGGLYATLEIREPKFYTSNGEEKSPTSNILKESQPPIVKIQFQEKSKFSRISKRPLKQDTKIIKATPKIGKDMSQKTGEKDYSSQPRNSKMIVLNRNSSKDSENGQLNADVEQFLEKTKESTKSLNQNEKARQSLDDYLSQYREELSKPSIIYEEKTMLSPQKEKHERKFLSSNDELFMNCFQCTTLPSPPNIPINESMKITNFSERDRYYKIAAEIMKIKKIIEYDPPNTLYYAQTV